MNLREENRYFRNILTDCLNREYYNKKARDYYAKCKEKNITKTRQYIKRKVWEHNTPIVIKNEKTVISFD